ncbi:MAG: hypothetical protein D6772_14625, partial [Bacteroidetes bacterium]
MLRSLFFFSLLVLLGNGLYAQGNSGPVYLLHFSYGPQLPFGDLADRYGQNFSGEFAGEYMLDNNW